MVFWPLGWIIFLFLLGEGQDPCGGERDRELAFLLGTNPAHLTSQQNGDLDTAEERKKVESQGKANTLASQERHQAYTPCSHPQVLESTGFASFQTTRRIFGLSSIESNVKQCEGTMEMQVLQKIVQTIGGVVPILWHRMAICTGHHFRADRSENTVSKTKIYVGLAVFMVGIFMECLARGNNKAEKDKEPQKGTRQRRADDTQRKGIPRKRWRRHSGSTLYLVFAAYATASSFCCSIDGFGPPGAIAAAPAERAGRIGKVPKSCKSPTWSAESPRRGEQSPGSCGHHSRERRNKNLQNADYPNGTVQERTTSALCRMAVVQNIMDPLLQRNVQIVGCPCSCLRARGAKLQSTSSRRTTETRRDQSQNLGNPCQDNSFGGAKHGLGLGRRRSRSPELNHEYQKDERCYVGSPQHDARTGRGNPIAKESGRWWQRWNLCASPSLGCTISLPYLGRWDQPPRFEAHSVKWADGGLTGLFPYRAPSEVNEAWESSKPTWPHSICNESDFKSPLEALRQGFLLEQEFLELDFNDQLQRFEPKMRCMNDCDYNASESQLSCDYNVKKSETDCDYDAQKFQPECDYFVQKFQPKCDYSVQKFQPECEYSVQKFQPDSRTASSSRTHFEHLEDDHHDQMWKGICQQDIETLCMELALDKELLEDGLWHLSIPMKQHFCVHFSPVLEILPSELRISYAEATEPSFWKHFLQHVQMQKDGSSLRLFRVHAGLPSIALGFHHVVVSAWERVPGLIWWPEEPERPREVADLVHWEKSKDVLHHFYPGLDLQNLELWQGGQNITAESLALQCGASLQVVARRPAVTCRVGEDDIPEPPNFEIGADEQVILAEDVQGRDDAIAIIRDDDNVLVQTLLQYAEMGSVHLIMFGHDGNYIGRRDADATPANLEAVQRTVEETWNDYEGHFLKVTLVQPQPPELTSQGLVLIVALQHVFAGQPNPRDGFVLCLAGIQLSYAGAHEPEIHRAFVIEEVFEATDLRLRLQINDLCQPHGRRECEFKIGFQILHEHREVRGSMGSYISAKIGVEKEMFHLRRACQEVDSLLSDLHLAVQDSRIRQIRMVQYGYRFRPIGLAHHLWEQTNPIDEVSLAQSFASGWLMQPLDRMKIHRVRALDAVDEHLGTLTLHFLVSFDLIPGYAICLMMGNAVPPWTIAGPHMLQPHFWDADGLSHEARNPLEEENYEILLYPGRTPTMTAISGDVIQYVEPTNDDAQDIAQEEGEEDEGIEMIQLHTKRLRSVFEPETIHPSFVQEEAYVPPSIPVAVGNCREELQLFPLLDDALPLDAGLSVPEPTVEEFLEACKNVALARLIPQTVFLKLKPISQAYLATCRPFQCHSETYHIFTDGAACTQKTEGHAFREASWATAVFRVSDKGRAFHGWLGGLVSIDPNERSFIGAEAKNAMNAERSAIFWSLVWCLSLPPNSTVIIHVDNQAACFGASGAWQIDQRQDLAVRIRSLAAFVETHCSISFEHVKAHSMHPQNELVDALAGQVADDARCVPHRRTIHDCKVAAFAQYKKLWFYQQKGKALPFLTEHEMIAESTLDEPTTEPNLQRDHFAFEENSEEKTASLDLRLATYNVMTLRPFEQDADFDQDSVYYGKAAYLQKQMDECNINALAVQEGRSKISGLFENAGAIRVVAEGTPAGTHGVELWLSKKQAYGRLGKKKLLFAKTKITVRQSSPTLLVVGYEIGKKTFVFVVCHTPQTGQEEQMRDAWWKNLSDCIQRIDPDEHLFVLGDFNARLPFSQPPQVGELVCGKSNGNTKFLTAFLQKHLLFAPSTFRAYHHGPIETWRHSSGSMSRIDYVFIKQDQWNSYESSAWPRLDAGNAVPDHFAVSLRVRAEWRHVALPTPSKAIDWQEIRDPKNQSKLCNVLNTIPVADWHVHPTDQVHLLTKSIHQKLREAFPLKGARFRKPYITEVLWNLRKSRCNLRALLRNFNRTSRDDQQDLWFGFRRLKNGPCSSTSRVLVLPDIATRLCVSLLRTTARSLKAGIKQERAQFVEKVSESANNNNTAQVFAELRKLGVNGKMRKRGTPPLPMWRDATGRSAENIAERATIWQDRCSDLEAGTMTTPQLLIQRAISRSATRKKPQTNPALKDLPSLTQIEAKLRSVRKNKAPGNDLLRSELCSLGAAPLAKHIHALTAKFVTFLEEPIQWKGGTLIAAYKHAGHMDDVKSYRSLLLSDHLGKSMRSWLRENFRGIYTDKSAETHFAGKLGGNPSHASSLTRSFLDGMGKRGISSSAYFVDVSSAYYRVVRELVVGMQTSDQEIIAILERFGLGPAEFRTLQEHLSTPPVFEQYGVPERENAMMESLMDCTWFTVIGSSDITRTRAGSRPGDTFADLVFAFVYSHLLQVLRDALADNGYVNPDSFCYGEEWKSVKCKDIELRHAPQLIDITWADDLVLLQAHEDCRELLRRITLAGGLLSDLCSRRGLQLNYKLGKTECLLRLKGKGTRALRCEIFGAENPSLKLPSTVHDGLSVRLVANYKHLGTQISLSSSQMHEIRVRTGQARAVYNKHRRTVFQNCLIAVKVRVKLLNVLVLSILNYNQGTWRPLNSKEWAYYQNAVMSMYRGVARANIPARGTSDLEQ